MQPGSSHHRVGPGGPLLEKGDLVAGKYRVERVIGSGGMGQVLAARHIELGNLFAIKVLRAEHADPQTVTRFMREAHAIARIQNDHIVRVHDVGQTERGFPYMVMEHLDGQDLGALLSARGPLPVDEAVGAILEACEGLADVHALGIVHRDIKPTNLFLARKSAAGDAAIKVVDFGLAKGTLVHPQSLVLSAKATLSGEIVGTGGYMAPEQLSGEATTRSDVWALGVTLYRLLTGKHPFAGKDTVELSVAALTADFRPMELFRQDIPPAIEGVVARCLRKIPEERYADARALGDALLDAFAQEPVPQSMTAPTPTRSTPRAAHQFVAAPPRVADEPTVLTSGPRSTQPISRDTTPGSGFKTSEEGLAGLDRKSKMMLVWSAVALICALSFLAVAIAWRRSAAEAHREAAARAAAASAEIVFPPAPPVPKPPEVVSAIPAAVSVIPAPAPAPAPEPVVAPAPEPVAAPPPAPAAPAPEPVATSHPVPEPVAVPAPVSAPAAPKKPVKKKALYDSP